MANLVIVLRMIISSEIGIMTCLTYYIVYISTFINYHICDLPRENRPSSRLVMIVEIPVLKFLIGVTSFCSC